MRIDIGITRVGLLKITAMFLILATEGCATKHASQPSTVSQNGSKETVYIDSENRLHYHGEFEDKKIDDLFVFYQNASRKPETLYISSGGGSVELGVKLGTWVHKQGLNVMVGKGCASSCANYVFTAGHKKLLSKDSVLIWHGSSYQDNINEKVESGDPDFVKWRQRDEQFFAMLSIDPKITVYGFDTYSLWDQLSALITFDPIMGFDYSLDDMEKLGVRNIVLVDGVWDWRKYKPDYNVKRANLVDVLSK